jgi:hypothetical protein
VSCRIDACGQGVFAEDDGHSASALARISPVRPSKRNDRPPPSFSQCVETAALGSMAASSANDRAPQSETGLRPPTMREADRARGPTERCRQVRGRCRADRDSDHDAGRAPKPELSRQGIHRSFAS